MYDLINTKCVEYSGKNHRPGNYGQIKRKLRGKKYWLAHRYEWALIYGDIPDSLCVLHKCDNPSCINVEHLFLGTRTDNNIDMCNKGRNYVKPKISVCARGHDLTKLNSRKPSGACRNCANFIWRRGYKNGLWAGGS